MVSTGGTERNPEATERLMRYWSTGEGGAEIGWGQPGDHTRCVQLIQKAITDKGRAPLPDHEIHGLCTNLQERATGSARDPYDSPKGNRGHG